MTFENFSIDKVRSDVLAAKANGSVFVLSHAAAIEVIKAFLAGLISKEQVAEWADFFDVNEDVDLESDEVLPDVLFELASPEINGWPDEARAMQLVALFAECEVAKKGVGKSGQ